LNERLQSVDEIRQWRDKIPFHWEYTAGVAGERFLRGLIEGKIVAGYCERCDEKSLPARMYCLNCYGRIERLVRAGPIGVAEAVTEDASGERFVFVTFDGIKGGVLHKAIQGVRRGAKVRPLFKPGAERVGSVLDIVGFEAAGGRTRRKGKGKNR
jgi:uncharacterized OB-fold protein